MANAYLGKISAIVTANTSDFNSKLNASAKEVRSFAASMQSALSRAETSAATSLRGIYTEAQKVERALKAAAGLRLSFKGIDTSKFKDITQAADQFRRVASAAEQIYKPLSLAAKATESLSNEVRGEFQPALIAAQRQAELMNRALSSGLAVSEKSFARVQRRAEATGQAVRRLAEASQIASSGPRGTELAFAAPRVRDSLTASAAIRQQAANAPASVIEGGTIARDVQKLVTIDNLIQKRRAEVESGILLNIDTTRARASLDSLLAVSEKVRRSISAAITPAAGGNRAEENQLALLQRRAQGEKELEARRAAAAQRSQDNEIALLQRRAQGEKELEARRAAAAQRAEDNEIALLIRREQAGKAAEAARFIGEGTFSPFSAPDAGARRVRGLAGGDPPDTGTALGRSLDVGRQVDSIAQKIASTRQQIDALPEGLRTRMIPALQQALNTLVDVERLGARATADQLSRANKEAERLAQNTSRVQRGQNFSEQFGGRGTRGLELNLQDTSLRGYTAQLQILQQTLAGVSTTARGPALKSFNELRKAIATAAKNGTLDLASTRQEIARLTTNAVNAASAVGKISTGRLAGQLKRAGDIGRGAFGNIGLGVQQAVFAFDDFFSVTGGLDQRIRAAGNNISQLGFVLGGTAGLITGVAVSITAQLIVAYIKWQNAGVGVEDRLKSLNDALSRQKSLVEDLAGAFRAIADEIANIGFSKPGADAAKFQQQLDDIRKKQNEFNQERFAELDPDVQRERGIVASREARLAKEEDPAVRLRLQGEINNARRREAEAARSARGAAPITAVEGARVAVESRRAREVQIAREAESPNEEAGANNRARQRQEDIDRRLGAASGERERQEIARDQLLFERNRLIREARSNDFSGAGILVGGSSNSEQLTAVEIAIRQLDQAIVDSADLLEVEVASAAVGAAKQIGLAQAKVADAIEAGVPGALGLQVQLDGLTQQLFKAQNDLATAQEKARKEETGEDIGAATKARDEVARIQDAINQRGGEIKAIEASRRAFELFATGFDKVRQEAESNLQAAESARDQAVGDRYEQFTEGADERLMQAQQDVNRQLGLRNEVRKEAARSEDLARNDEGVRLREEEIAQIDRQLSSSGVIAPGQRDTLVTRRERLRQENESAVDDRVKTSPLVRKAITESIEEERRRQSAERGRQASQTPAQKAGEELAGTLRDIQKNFERRPGGVAGNAAEAADAGRRAANDAFRTSAPAILGLADQVQNAVLQGPSRAALNATDVSTVEGSRELNRLLRGDDAAKNQDLVELQKQSQSLETLVQLAREQGVPATLDF